MLLSGENLRESILRVGPILPAYFWGAVLLDGKKRIQACGELGIQLKEVFLDTPEQAAALLWSLHPDRAVEMFRPDTLTQAGELFCAPLATLAKYYKRTPKTVEKRKQPRSVWAKQRGVSRTFRLPPSLIERFQSKAQKLGMHWSEYARICMSYGIENEGEILEHSRIVGPLTRKPGRPKG